MFDTRFNNGYQIMPQQNIDSNGYQIMPQEPYSMYEPDPSLMNNVPYPQVPAEIPASTQTYNPAAYARGGGVSQAKYWAQKLRRKGNNGDTELAHINPLEEMILKSIGGSGTINPKTGLPQYGFFSNPGKWLKSVAGPVGGTILGNMLLPGIGGILGGALGGAAGSAVRGRKDFGQAALRGAGIGALTPTAAGLAGKGISALGAPGTGEALTGYGEQNAIFPALDRMLGFSSKGAATGAGLSSIPNVFAANKKGSALENYNRYKGISGVSAGDEEESKKDFLDKLLDNSKDYLTKPKNILALASAASSFANRPKKEKPKTPEQEAEEIKRFQKALMLNPSERAARELDLLAEAKMKRAIALNQFLPQERLTNLEPIHRKSHTPEEQKKFGRWFSYYNNPNFTGEPLPFKKGGIVERIIDIGIPTKSSYISGIGGGQDDKLKTQLPDKAYMVDASTISDLGDGNSEAGANTIDNTIDALISSGEYYISPEDVARFGKVGAKRLDALVKNVRKHKRGGGVKLPPKAKSFSNYLR